MDWEFIAPMIFSSILVLSVAAVFILRPLAKRLGTVLERMQEQKSLPTSEELRRITQLLEHMDDRMNRLEQRQEFTERMLSERQGEGPIQDAALGERSD